MKDGRILEGPYERYSAEHNTFFINGPDSSSFGVSLSNTLFLEVAKPSGNPVLGNYSFGGLMHTLAEFPRPFVGDDGSLDLLFVYGEGSRDYADYRQFLRQKGQKDLPPSRVGKRGDFEYLSSLSLALGFHAGRTNVSLGLPSLPLAKQGLQLIDGDLKHNLVVIGSGAVNTISKQIFEIYGQGLPIRFKTPDSDDMIIDSIGDEPRTYSRRNDGEWNTGMIEIVPNPFYPTKVILLAAGLTVLGTQAALLALSDAVFHRNLRNRTKKIDGGIMTVPAQLVIARDVRYVNGLETTYGYDLV
jgi:hypothetical protein